MSGILLATVVLFIVPFFLYLCVEFVLRTSSGLWAVEDAFKKLLVAFIVMLHILGVFMFAISIFVNEDEPARVNSDAPQSEPDIMSVMGVNSVDTKELSQLEYFTVTRIVDGDTIEVVSQQRQEFTVRMIGIDTPETGECLFDAAKSFAQEELQSERVYLVEDPTQDLVDRYGRLLRYVVRVDDGYFYNLDVIRQGFALEYTYDKPYRFQSDFIEANNIALQNKAGLYSTECECFDRAGDEISRKCTACKRSTVEYMDNDCSVYTETVEDLSCISECPVITPPTPKPAVTTPRYTCNCSKTCPNLSCDEAQYQLNVCGCSRRDGDNDGIACDASCQ